MPEILRSRDCVLLVKGDIYAVTVSQAMVNGGWPGGQGVQWVDVTVDDRVVTYSSGRFGGFLLWGSDEPADRFTAMTRQSPTYAYGVMVSGASLISTSTYEKYTYASRIGAGPLVPLLYGSQDELYFSLRGLFTKEDELTISGDSRAPALPVGFVAQVPRASNGMFLGIQTI